MTNQTVITCTNEGTGSGRVVRVIVPTHPDDPEADFRHGLAVGRQMGQCPHCRDVNLEVQQRDIFGRVARRQHI